MEKIKEERKIKTYVLKPEIYSRVVGYFRPVQNWNTGKKQEFKERKVIKIDKGISGDNIN